MDESLAGTGAVERDGEGFFFTSRGVRLYARTWGMPSAGEERAEGRTPLVLLHGFMQDSRIWEPVAVQLAHDRPVCALDFTGFGKSERPEGALPYRIEEMAASVRDLVSIVGGPEERVHVAGYSMGGRIALAFADAHPEHAASLVLESAGMGPDTPEARASANARDAAWIEMLRTASIEEFVDYWEGLPLFASQRCMTEEARETLREIRLSSDPSVLARCIQGAGQHAMSYFGSALRGFRMPILYLAGMADEKYTKVALKLAARGRATCSLLACGHNVHTECPAAYVGHVRPFLAHCDEAVSSNAPAGA